MSSLDSGRHRRTLGYCWIIYGIIRLVIAIWLVLFSATANLWTIRRGWSNSNPSSATISVRSALRDVEQSGSRAWVGCAPRRKHCRRNTTCVDATAGWLANLLANASHDGHTDVQEISHDDAG